MPSTETKGVAAPSSLMPAGGAARPTWSPNGCTSPCQTIRGEHAATFGSASTIARISSKGTPSGRLIAVMSAVLLCRWRATSFRKPEKIETTTISAQTPSMMPTTPSRLIGRASR